jgi:hypothetical protein
VTGERRLELGRANEALEEVVVPDDLEGHPQLKNMWARAFVRLLRDLAGVISGRSQGGEPAGFRDGWRVQRVLEAVRRGAGASLD